MNIKTNYIDFRNEHRIYLLEGILDELVGMIAVTNFDDLDEDSPGPSASPKTTYKLILNPDCMYTGGVWEEGDLPSVFAHRGDIISHPLLLKILLGNIFFRTDDAVSLMFYQLKKYDLKVEELTKNDITLRLDRLSGDDFRVGSDLHSLIDYPLTFISYSDNPKGIRFSIGGNEEVYSFYELANRIGEIVYALQEYFSRDVNITRICEVKNQGSSNEQEVELPESYSKFLRLVRLAAEKERKIRDCLLKEEFSSPSSQSSHL